MIIQIHLETFQDRARTSARAARTFIWHYEAKIQNFTFFIVLHWILARARLKVQNSESASKMEQKHSWTLFHISKIDDYRRY